VHFSAGFLVKRIGSHSEWQVGFPDSPGEETRHAESGTTGADGRHLTGTATGNRLPERLGLCRLI
jgi:hypothetical protein